MSAVSSRAFRLYGNKRPDGTHVDAPMLLPLIDMCNHSFMPNAEIVQEKEANNENMLVKVCSVLDSLKLITKDMHVWLLQIKDTVISFALC